MLHTPSHRRVLLVTEVFPPDTGGSAALFGNTYARLEPDSVTVIRHARDGCATEWRDGRLRTIAMTMTGGHWGITSVVSLRRYGRLAARLRRECRREPSIVHCARALPEGFAALCATWAVRRPAFLCWALGEELAYAKSSRELTLLARRVLLRAPAVLAISRSTVREVESLGVAADRIHLVHPGVDAAAFTRRPESAKIRERFARPGEVLLLTVGRLQRRKGHDLVIQALTALGPDMRHVRYLIVGDGEERPRLEQLAREAGVLDRVTFAGAVPADVLRDYYCAADVFVHPNRVDGFDVEGFGIVFLEAAAAGLPTIGGITGGTPDAVEADVTGFLVSGADHVELASVIRRLAGSPELRRLMGEAGRVRVQRDFTWERAARQVAEIHRTLAAARVGRAGES